MSEENKRRVHPLVLTLMAVGGLLATAALVVVIAMPSEQVGDVESIEASLVPAEPVLIPTTPSLTPEPDADLAAQQQSTVSPNENSRLDELAGGSGLLPVGLQIDAIGVDAPIEAFGINSRTGEMDVPRNVREVAWYEYGPSPGEHGSAVLAAHVDLSSQGPGVFFRLRDLNPGDLVTVTYDDGSEARFVVEARITYEKDELPVDTIFSRGGAPVLTLITCGGGFNSTAQSYDSNVVVYAVPVATPATEAPEAA